MSFNFDSLRRSLWSRGDNGSDILRGKGTPFEGKTSKSLPYSTQICISGELI